MKTLEELKQEMDMALAAWDAARAAYDAAADRVAYAAAAARAAYVAYEDDWDAYHKRLKEVENEDA